MSQRLDPHPEPVEGRIPPVPGAAWRSAAVGLLAAALLAGSAVAEEPDPADTGSIWIELNRLETVGTACQPYLVFENRTDHALTDLRLDLVMFDADGVVADRLAIDAAPLPAGKTSLVVFQVPSMSCEAIGRLLLNTVIACAGGPVTDSACIGLVETDSRLAVPFFK